MLGAAESRGCGKWVVCVSSCAEKVSAPQQEEGALSLSAIPSTILSAILSTIPSSILAAILSAVMSAATLLLSPALRLALLNNEPAEDCLHVVCCVSNPCGYRRRYELARDFCARMGREPSSSTAAATSSSVLLYVVELAYEGQDFHVTSASEKRHLQLRSGGGPLWHKENLINVAVRHLLPSSWKAFAWIDADVEFLSPHWASDALKLLNGMCDVVQLFSHALDLDAFGSTMQVFSSFGFRACEHGLEEKLREHRCHQGAGSGAAAATTTTTLGTATKKMTASASASATCNFPHPGFAWAMTRRSYERLGGLYEYSVLGSGDSCMALAFVGRAAEALNAAVHQGYLGSLLEYEQRARGLRLGYVPGVLRHFFHGLKKNRRYGDRWRVLVAHGYNPSAHVAPREDGLLVPSAACPAKLLKEIAAYFAQRNEDEGYREAMAAR